MGWNIVPGPCHVVTTLYLFVYITHHSLVLYLVVAAAIWLLALRSSPLQLGGPVRDCPYACQQDYIQEQAASGCSLLCNFCFLVSTYFLVDMLRGSPDYLIYVVNDYEIE